MTKIILHGYLKDLHPDEILVHANSAAEALQSLSLIKALRKPDGGRHTVVVKGFDSQDALYERQQVDELHVHPVMAGAGKPGVGQIIIGIILIIIGYFTFGSTTKEGMAFIMAGIGAMLGGVLQMLAPQPNFTVNNEEKSKYLGNGRNTVAIGTRIPMIYGRRKAFGHYVSFDIDAGFFNQAPADWYSSPFTDYGELTYSAAPVALPIEPPASMDKKPTALFSGFSTPLNMTDEMVTYVNFTPVALMAGEYDASFDTGQILRVTVPNNGTYSQATVVGSSIVLPNIPNGTSVAFSRNYG